MEPAQQTSKVRLWISYLLQGIVVIMFVMGAVQNIMRSEMAVEGAKQMGYPESSVLYLGILLLLVTILYAIPKTNILGAAFLTAWLGGAVATHVINEDAMLNLAMPIIFGILVWLALLLRDSRLGTIFPLRK